MFAIPGERSIRDMTVVVMHLVIRDKDLETVGPVSKDDMVKTWKGLRGFFLQGILIIFILEEKDDLLVEHLNGDEVDEHRMFHIPFLSLSRIGCLCPQYFHAIISFITQYKQGGGRG